MMLTQEEIRPFIIAAHHDLGAVKAMLAEQPALLNEMFVEWNETALGAASHVGNREIAEYLLAQGAPLTICTAAMLAQATEVAAFLQADPAQANARGAHGIPVLVHAGMGGSVAILQMLADAGGSLAAASYALHGAAAFGHTAAAEWLLERGADPLAQDWQGKTSVELAQAHGHAELARRLQV